MRTILQIKIIISGMILSMLFTVSYAQIEWEKYEGNPILSKTEAIEGPGNGMFVKSPDGTELFIVYHTHFKPGQVGPRRVAIDRVRFQEVENGPDILAIDGPTSTPQPMPSAAK